MRLAALVSGGKDSLYAAWLAKQAGHELVCLVGVISENPESYMFHTPNIALVRKVAECMGVPLVSVRTKGEKEKELEDINVALAALSRPIPQATAKPGAKPNAMCPRCGAKFVCNPGGDCWCKSEPYVLPVSGDRCLCPACLRPRIEGIVCGAIASSYQKSRIERIARELGLALVAPLWGKRQEDVLRGEINSGFKSIIVHVAAAGLDEKWLGRELDRIALSDLLILQKRFGVSPVGEGGEFETLVLDCPLFGKRIKVLASEKKWDTKTRSGTLEITEAELIKK